MVWCSAQVMTGLRGEVFRNEEGASVWFRGEPQFSLSEVDDGDGRREAQSSVPC